MKYINLFYALIIYFNFNLLNHFQMNFYVLVNFIELMRFNFLNLKYLNVDINFHFLIIQYLIQGLAFLCNLLIFFIFFCSKFQINYSFFINFKHTLKNYFSSHQLILSNM